MTDCGKVWIERNWPKSTGSGKIGEEREIKTIKDIVIDTRIIDDVGSKARRHMFEKWK